MIPASFFLPDVPHFHQPDDYSCSEMGALILHEHLGIEDFNGSLDGDNGLRRFVEQCSTKIRVHNTDQDIHFENMLPCMSPKLDCHIVHLNSIDDLKRNLYELKLPVIVRYKVQYRHSVVARGYTPEHIIVNDPASISPATSIPSFKLDKWWEQARDLSPKGRPVMICRPKAR